jgi:hypothetical protein
MDVTGSTVHLNTPDGKMEAYEARPRDSGSYPGIVVLMEAFGLNDHIKKVTERIAEGYVPPPDLYHRESERVYRTVSYKARHMNRLQDQSNGRRGAAIAHLKSQITSKGSPRPVSAWRTLHVFSAAHHGKTSQRWCSRRRYSMGKPALSRRNCVSDLFSSPQKIPHSDGSRTQNKLRMKRRTSEKSSRGDPRFSVTSDPAITMPLDAWEDHRPTLWMCVFQEKGKLSLFWLL